MGLPTTPVNHEAEKDGEDPIWAFHSFGLSSKVITELVRQGKFPDDSDLHIQELPPELRKSHLSRPS